LGAIPQFLAFFASQPDFGIPGLMFKKSKHSGPESKPETRPVGEDASFASQVEDFSYDEGEDDEAPGSVEDTARYIADMVGAMAAMANEARLDLLTYLLNMARVEAELQARQNETLESDGED
jgi:hypothetical protein